MHNLKFFSTLLISFIITAAVAQDKPINQLDSNGKKTGVWETYHPNGKLKSHGNFVNGQPVGQLLKYYPGGIMQTSMDFDKTGRIAYVKMYYETGNLASEGKYIDQKKDSVWNFYSTWDKRKALTETYKMGLKNGPSYKYYSNGKPSEYIEWKNDQRDGKWEQYYENGQLRSEGKYINGSLDGDFKSYNPNGTASINGRYIMGTMDGNWHYFNENGEDELIIEYKNGQMVPNPEVEKRIEEFSKKVKDAIGNLDEIELPETN